MKTGKIGTLTLSLGLIATGILILMRWMDIVSLQLFQYMGPSLLIVFGIEILRGLNIQSKTGQRVTFGMGSIMLLIIVLVINLAQFMLPWQPVFSSPVHGQVQVDGTIKQVEIQIPDGKVSITGTTEQVLSYTGQLVTKEWSQSAADKAIAANWKIRTSGDRLVLTLEQPYLSHKFSLFDWFRKSPRSPYLNVQVPQVLLTKVSTSNGAIEVIHMKADMDMKTLNGPIAVQQVEGNVKAKTSNGSIEMTKIEGSAHMDTSNGTITLGSIAGSVFARTSNGHIQANSVVNEDWECNTSNGTIKMTLSGEPNVTIQAKTSNGSIGGDANGKSTGMVNIRARWERVPTRCSCLQPMGKFKYFGQSKGVSTGIEEGVTLGKITIRIIVFVLAFGICAYALIQYGFFSAKDASFVSIKLRKPDFHLEPWVYVLYAHIISAVLALVIGPFQLFLKPAGLKRVKRHRRLGYTYVLSVSISGLVSIFLSLYATGGWAAGLGFLLLDALWVTATWISVNKIAVRNDIQAHKEWMLRSYALTFAAVTLRLWLPVLLILYAGSFIPSYQVVAWLCWIPNLLFIETVIRFGQKRNPSKGNHQIPKIT
ncbi:DUF2306 domain-containing protein [Paenibacillus sp. N3.4]|uniref:DUF2306 domain-containing protein n=1 Tax=Paenibacillus sp. N3.4 TaxID=2603222 RepID=UPI0011CABF04|nr:DUF2306 domain-containing protein [Paenibacillus sp. N3.4]TXK83457.1 DUF2306 domain-containing protein [Paenibacillus sp. N3.4]